MSNIVSLEIGTSKSRREVARYLREIAAAVEADTAETEPYAVLVVLTGVSRHEVLWTGYEGRQARGGAARAADAVCCPHYETHGGNIRSRTHSYGPERQAAPVVSILTKPSEEPSA